MTAARRDFTFKHGDTPGPFGFRLSGRNVLSGAIITLPRPSDVISWTIAWPEGSVTKTTAANGGLTVDSRTSFVTWPLTLADVNAIPLSAAILYSVRLTDGDGNTEEYLKGTIGAEAASL